MSAATRRAALGAILAAPLASVPVAAALPRLPDYEARFLEIGPQLVLMLDEHDRLWELIHPYYAAWEVARERLTDKRWRAAEELPEWGAYMAARAPSDAIAERLDALYSPYDDEPMTTLPAILLRLRYAMTFDAYEAEALKELREHWKRCPLCA